MRLIDADEIRWVDHYDSDGNLSKYKVAFSDEMPPAVDAAPVRHGRWIDEGQYADFFPHHAWRCSECGEHVIEIDTPWYKYCPNCGARMDAE